MNTYICAYFTKDKLICVSKADSSFTEVKPLPVFRL